MKMKKMLGIFLALCICAVYLPLTEYTFPETVQISADAEESGTCGENLKWTIDNGILTISGTGAMTDWKAEEGISSPWAYRSDIRNVIIKDGVTSIGERAFWYCTNLTEITIPDSVNCIGGSAFYDCQALTEITIPEGVTAIEALTFYESGLTSVVLPESVTSIGASAFAFCNALESITIWNRDCEITLSGMDYMNEYTIPLQAVIHGYPTDEKAGIYSDADWYAKKYGMDFFALSGTCGDDLLWSIDHSGTLTISGTGKMPDWSPIETINSPWNENKMIRKIIIQEGVTSIGRGAFQDCFNLTETEIPDSVTKIGKDAFDGTPWLEKNRSENPLIINHILIDGKSCVGELTVPEDVISIGGGAFAWGNVTSVILPAGVISIGEAAFLGCEDMTSIMILNPECAIEDEINTIYNGMLTIYGYPDSTAQAHAEKYDIPFIILEGEPETAKLLGDINGDKKINAEDAALILAETAAIGAGLETTFTQSGQYEAADVNKNGTVNAEDAAYVLSYTAAVGANQTDLDIEGYIASL